MSSLLGQIPNNNEYISYFPLIGIVDISLYGVTSAAPIRGFITIFRIAITESGALYKSCRESNLSYICPSLGSPVIEAARRGKPRHFPIFDLEGGGGKGASRFSIYFVHDCRFHCTCVLSTNQL